LHAWSSSPHKKYSSYNEPMYLNIFAVLVELELMDGGYDRCSYYVKDPTPMELYGPEDDEENPQ